VQELEMQLREVIKEISKSETKIQMKSQEMQGLVQNEKNEKSLIA
jgi:hypothetical protein